MQLVTPKRSTKRLEKGFLYELVSEVDSFGYFKVREPVNPVEPDPAPYGTVHYIHTSNMRKVKVI